MKPIKLIPYSLRNDMAQFLYHYVGKVLYFFNDLIIDIGAFINKRTQKNMIGIRIAMIGVTNEGNIEIVKKNVFNWFLIHWELERD